MRTSGILALLVLLGTAVPATAQYGFDAVPNSTFSHHHDWARYGSDPVPSTYKHTEGLATTFGVDRVPGVIRDRWDRHPDHELIAATIQHLTAAIEYTPARRAASAQRATSGPQRGARP